MLVLILCQGRIDLHLNVFSIKSVKIDEVNYKVFDGNDITIDELLQSLENTEFESDKK